MKFFVYTLARDSSNGQVHAKFADSEYVNAQPLREVLSMMTMRQGKMFLHLPLRDGVHPVQWAITAFEVDRYITVVDPRNAQLLTSLAPKDFLRFLAVTERYSVAGLLWSISTAAELMTCLAEWEASNAEKEP